MSLKDSFSSKFLGNVGLGGPLTEARSDDSAVDGTCGPELNGNFHIDICTLDSNDVDSLARACRAIAEFL